MAQVNLKLTARILSKRRVPGGWSVVVELVELDHRQTVFVPRRRRKGMSVQGNPTQDYTPGADMSRDTTGRCLSDQRLRRFGYEIHSRAPGREPVWKSKEGRVFPESVALRRIEEELSRLESK